VQGRKAQEENKEMKSVSGGVVEGKRDGLVERFAVLKVDLLAAVLA
jgi:hypothetical protein